MTLGLSRLTALASTSPIVRPASRSRRLASTEPPRARATTSWLEVRVDARGAQPAGDRRPAGHRLEAADVAAAAHGVDVVGHLDVAEVAGGALGAATQRAVADDAAADAGGDLDEQQVVDVAEPDEVLAEGHDVDVVVDDDDARRARPARSRARRSRPSPGMIGGFVGRPVACSTGPGQPDADAGDVGRAGGRPRCDEAAAVLDDPAQHGLRAERRCRGRRARSPAPSPRGR